MIRARVCTGWFGSHRLHGSRITRYRRYQIRAFRPYLASIAIDRRNCCSAGRGRQRLSVGAGRERVDHQRGEAPPRVGRGLARRRQHPRVGQQHDHDIGHRDVGAQAAVVLGADHQLPQFLDGLGGALLHHAAGRERRRQHLAQTGVTGLQFAQFEHQAAEALPRVGGGQRPVDRLGEPRDVALEGGRGQIRAGRKAAVERRHADAGAARHLVERQPRSRARRTARRRHPECGRG